MAAGFGSESGGLVFNESNLTCSPAFYLANSTCLPICQEWKQYPDKESAAVVGCIVMASVVAILGGVAMIVGSFIRYKAM